MNPLLLKALIVDQDEKQALTMSQLMSEIMGKVHIARTAGDAVTEFKDTHPNVLMFNLNISQRTQNFEIVEALGIDENFHGIVLGYCDASEPQLVAHAIELGFHDIFFRPFDPDIIASKINKYLPSEKTKERDISVQRLKPAVSGKINLPLTLLSVDENGLTLTSSNYVAKGTIFILRGPLMVQMLGSQEAEFMVTKSWEGSEWGEHFFFAEPKNADENTSATIRKFILEKL